MIPLRHSASTVFLVLLFVACQKQFQGSVLSHDGVSIAYTSQGKGRPALVFVHGWSCDKTYWDAQVDYFAQNYQVVTIDLGGHGESGLNREDWNIGAFGKDVQAVVEKLDLDRIILIGHSMGGGVIVEASKHMPDRVIGLIGVDTFQNIEEKPTPEEMDAFLAPLRKDFSEATKDFVSKYLFAPHSDSAFVEKIVTDMAEAPPEVGLSAMKNSWTYDVPSALKEVRVPVRCINTDLYPVNVDAGKRHAKSFDVRIMSGVGHFLMMEDPETFNTLLEETIQELVKIDRNES